MNSMQSDLKKALSFALIIGGVYYQTAQAQISSDELGGRLNVIETAVPFVTITPDSRSAGFADIGAATTPDASAIHFNSAKLPFAEKNMGFMLSYVPWLRSIVPDINLAYMSFYSKLKNDQVVGGSFRYFSLGDITFTNITGDVTGQFRPNELAVDLTYARKLSENFSGGFSARYIYSNLTGGQLMQGGAATNPGQSVAVDISTYYRSNQFTISDKNAIAGAGLSITNIGNKIKYTDNARSENFIPTNLRLGGSLKLDLDQYNSIEFMSDIQKLLVPSTPIYAVDANGNNILDANGNKVIAYGKDPYVGVAKGMIQSFSDAPGVLKSDGTRSVLREELNEVMLAGGLEYWYDKQFALRFGYFHEHATKGNRKYFTLGAGVRYNVFGLDFAYLIPTVQRHPLERTMRFTLTMNFDSFKSTGGNSRMDEEE